MKQLLGSAWNLIFGVCGCLVVAFAVVLLLIGMTMNNHKSADDTTEQTSIQDEDQSETHVEHSTDEKKSDSGDGKTNTSNSAPSYITHVTTKKSLTTHTGDSMEPMMGSSWLIVDINYTNTTSHDVNLVAENFSLSDGLDNSEASSVGGEMVDHGLTNIEETTIKPDQTKKLTLVFDADKSDFNNYILEHSPDGDITKITKKK